MSYRSLVFAALLGLTMLAQPRFVEAAEVVHTIQFEPSAKHGDGGVLCAGGDDGCSLYLYYMDWYFESHHYRYPQIPGFDATLGDLSSMTVDTALTVALPRPGTAEVLADFGIGLLFGPEPWDYIESAVGLHGYSQQQPPPECEPTCPFDRLFESSSSQSVFDDDLERFIGPEPFFAGYGGYVRVISSGGFLRDPFPSVSIVMTYTYTPAPLAVEIDIMPGNDRNPMSPGVIPVAILGSDTFDVLDVDVTTLSFGPAEAQSVLPLTTPWVFDKFSHIDVNHDGHKDLFALYRTQEAGIALGDPEACLNFVTLDETAFEGCDHITTVPNACGLGFELVLMLPPLMLAYGSRRRPRH